MGYGNGEQKAESHHSQPQEDEEQGFQSDSFRQCTVVSSSHSACMPGQCQAPAAARLMSAAVMLALAGWASALPQPDMARVFSTSSAAQSQRPGRFGAGKRRAVVVSLGSKGKAWAMQRLKVASGSALTSEGKGMRMAMAFLQRK